MISLIAYIYLWGKAVPSDSKLIDFFGKDPKEIIFLEWTAFLKLKDFRPKFECVGKQQRVKSASSNIYFGNCPALKMCKTASLDFNLLTCPLAKVQKRQLMKRKK